MVNKRTVKIIKYILFFLICAVVLSEVLFLSAVPFALNKMADDGFFTDFVRAKTGLIFSADNAKFHTYPDFSIKAEITCPKLNTKNGKNVMSAANLSGKIYLIPLFSGRVNATDFLLKNYSGLVYRDKNGEFLLGDYKLVKIKKYPKFVKFSGRILNSKLKFTDKKLNKSFILTLDDVNVKKFKNKKYVKLMILAGIESGERISRINLHVDTKLPVVKNTQKKDFCIKGNVENLDISSAGMYAKEFGSKDIKSLNGVFNADFDFCKELSLNARLADFAVALREDKNSVYSKGVISINFLGNIKKENLNIEKLTLQHKDWRIDTFGLLKNINSRSPQPDLSVKIPDADLHSLIDLLPPVENTNHAAEKLKRYGVWGRMTGELSIKGTLKKPLVYGKATLTNLHILKEKPIVAPCSMDLKFRGKDVDIYTKVFADKNKQQFVIIEGYSELKTFGKGEIKIKSTENVDLKTAHYMLVPIHDIVGFDLGPLPYMSIKGKGSIDLITRGTVFDGEAYGRFKFKDTDALLKGLHTRIKKAHGQLDFKGKDMFFSMHKAQIDGCPVTVSGTANLDGNIDFSVNSPAITTNELVSIVNGSELLKSKKQFTQNLKRIEGKSKTDIKLKGVVKTFSGLKDVSDLDFSGDVYLDNNTVHIKNIPVLTNTDGHIHFENKDLRTDISSSILGAKIYLNADLKDNEKAVVKIKADGIKTDELIDFLFNSEKSSSQLPRTNSLLFAEALYRGHPFKINYNNIFLHGFIKPVKSGDDLFIKSGEFSLKNNTFKLKNFDTAVFDTTAHADMLINKFFSISPEYNGNLTVVNFNIENFNKLRKMKILPRSLQKALLAYENYEGRADIRLHCIKNNVTGEIRLLNLKFLQSAYKIPITIDSGNIFINNNKITLKSINANFDNVPIFINAYINGLSRNSVMKGYFTTKVTEPFVNKYINERLSYPLKPKGDITLTAEIQGRPEKYNVNTKLRLEKDADIYYMGANLDDTDDEREITADLSVKKNDIKINSINYIRYMTSQNDYVYPRKIITMYGNIKPDKNKFLLNNLHIKTENNANVKLFNVLFKKSVLKKGMFNCDLVLNGDAATPKILGKAGMFELDMPLYTTLIKDVDMQFTPSDVNIEMNGMSYDSDFVLKTVITNKPVSPVVVKDLKISSKSLELDKILDSLNQVTLNTGIKLDDETITEEKPEKKQTAVLSNIIIQKGEISADKMQIRGLPAKNYKAVFKLDRDMLLRIEKLNFEIAEGLVRGMAKYDFKTGKISAEIMAKHVDANKIATAIFEAKDQIFGYLNGSMMFSTKGNTEEERINNVSGSVYFEINDGKMPKLGSVEYLLKASSLFKSGITGVSINNFIDLIAPVKTGYFNSIKGLLLINKGKAKNVEIFSSGENLSMYIKGTYDIPESFADLNVYGRLTKKADNILGPVGNMSFNSLLNLIPGFKLDSRDKTALVKELNKIPGVEFNDMHYRIFNARINGNINSDKYVKYFKWIE